MENKWMYPKNMDQMQFEEKHKRNVLDRVKSHSSDGDTDGAKSRKRLLIRRLGYSGVAVATLFILLIGSTYFSLGMAKVAAKIPYFSLFIKQEEYKYALHDVIVEVINTNQYPISNMEVSIPNRAIKIWLIGSKSEVNNMKTIVKTNINEELVANNFGRYQIEIRRGKEPGPDPAMSPEDEKAMKDSIDLENRVMALLEENSYKPAFPVQARVNKIERFIYVALPKTEKRVPELKEQLMEMAEEYEGGKIKLRITAIDMAAREQELRWGKNNIIHILVGGLMDNKSFKVTGFSYSFHPLPLEIKIKTSVKSTDPEAKKLAAEIEQEINDFIQTHELTKEVRNDPYEVMIYSKDNKIINK